MGFEKRRNSEYYYRKKRRGNRVISEYVGNSEYARLAARVDRLCALKKADDAQNLALLKQKDDEIEQLLTKLESKNEILIETFLENIGFSKTKSREWRYKSDK